MTDDIASEGEIGYPVTGHERGLIARREENREAVLSGQPVILHDVALDQPAGTILNFEQIFDQPIARLLTKASLRARTGIDKVDGCAARAGRGAEIRPVAGRRSGRVLRPENNVIVRQ